MVMTTVFRKLIVASFCSILFVFNNIALAKVPKEVADRLKGSELTPMGAIRAGNETGTIPAWTGEILGAPDWVDYKPGDYYPNPYPDEEPLFVITAENYKNYAQNLSDGQIALFEKYPETFKMPIYPTKRDTRYTDTTYEHVYRNALEAELVPGGNGVLHVFGGPAFPFPKNGQELIWNHPYSPAPPATIGEVAAVSVFESGSRAIQKRMQHFYFAIFSPEIKREEFDGVAAYAMILSTAPAREKGKVTLVHEYSNLTETPRNAWQYLPGTRRVRRAPTIAYDFPDGPGGLRTVDDAIMYNGATDRYTFKMEGKRELYIPYNNYDMDSPKLDYSEEGGFLTKYHVNPKYMRYELHRTWVVLAELKPGKRHIYAKRRLYMDEDTWAGLMSDNYDAQGNLWRTNMRTYLNRYDMPGLNGRIEIYHDLQKSAYLANDLINEEGGPPRMNPDLWPENFFTPGNMRKLGIR
jgi:hypothetical protein